MKWTAIILIALTILFGGCSQNKAPETNAFENREAVEQTTAEKSVTESKVDTSEDKELASTKKKSKEVEAAGESSKQADNVKNTKYIVYYMTTTARCASCYKIENWTKEAIKKYFADEMKSGDIKFEMVNIEEPENEHYIDHYEIFTKSVIISKKIDGKEVSWKNLARVWNLLRDQDDFMTYVRDEIKQFITGAES